MIAGGIGNALSQGVDSFLKVRSMKNEQESDRKRLGLLAAKENMELDPDTGEYGLNQFGASQQEGLLAKQKSENEKLATEQETRVAGQDPVSPRSAQARTITRGLLNRARPGLGDQIVTEDMSEDDIHKNPYIEKALTGEYAIKAAHEKANSAAGTVGPLTPAQKKVDQTYGERYNLWTEKGRNNAANAIKKLEGLAAEMENAPDGGGGRFAGRAPDWTRNRDAIRVRDTTRNAANTTLKELFGGQLSDAEREAAAKEYYNDALDNQTNAQVLRQKIQDLRDNFDSQEAKADEYERAGTLKYFKAKDAGSSGLMKKGDDDEKKKTKLPSWSAGRVK